MLKSLRILTFDLLCRSLPWIAASALSACAVKMNQKGFLEVSADALEMAAPAALTGLTMSNPSNGTASAYTTIPITGTFSADAGSADSSTLVTANFYLNDPSCGAGNLVATTSGLPGSALAVTTSSVTAGGNGLKTLYYTVENTLGNVRSCAAAGLSFTYQATPVVSFTALGFTVTESGAQVGTALSVQRDVCGVATSVTVDTSSVTAISGTNFTASTETVNFAASDCSPKTIAVGEFGIVNDAAVTGDLFFKAVITGMTGATADTRNQIAQVNILDAGYAGEFLFTQPLYTAYENETSVQLTVQRSGSTAAAASVDVAFVDGSGTAGVDYTGTTQTVNFGIGDDEETVTVPVAPNGANRSFIAKLVNASTGTGPRNLSVAKIRILDDATTCNPAGAPFGGGTGTLPTPYLICSLAHLKAVATNLTNDFRMRADVVADGTLVPLGTYTGNFDGDEHVVFNFEHSGNTSGLGLFNQVSGGSYFKSLNLLNARLTNTGSTYAGMMIGIAGNTTTQPAFSHLLASGYVSHGSTGTGGIIGAYVSAATGALTQFNFSKSLAFGVIRNTSSGSVGGVVGYALPNAGVTAYSLTFSHLYNAANVVGSANNSGGILGRNGFRGTIALSNLENRGYVSGGADNGGIIGENGCTQTDTVVTASDLTNYGWINGAANSAGIVGNHLNCFTSTFSTLTNYGNVNGSTPTGGLFGTLGISVANNASAALSDPINRGNVTGTGDNAGGLIGYFSVSGAVNGITGTITNAANYGNITGNAYVAGLIARLNYANTGGAPTNNSLSVTNFTNSGAILSTSTGASVAYVGGAFGQVNASLSSEPLYTFTGITNTGTSVTCTAGTGCGGLIGRAEFSSTKTLTLSDCRSDANVTGADDDVGGLIGMLYPHASGATVVSRCEAHGNVAGDGDLGGLIGTIRRNATASVTTIEDSYATGTVTGVTGRVSTFVGNLTAPSAGLCTVNMDRNYTISQIASGGALGSLWTGNTNCTANVTESYWLKDTGINAGVGADAYARDQYDLSHLTGQTNATFTGWTFGGGGPWNAFVPGAYPTLQ